MHAPSAVERALLAVALILGSRYYGRHTRKNQPRSVVFVNFMGHILCLSGATYRCNKLSCVYVCGYASSKGMIGIALASIYMLTSSSVFELFVSDSAADAASTHAVNATQLRNSHISRSHNSSNSSNSAVHHKISPDDTMRVLKILNAPSITCLMLLSCIIGPLSYAGT